MQQAELKIQSLVRKGRIMYLRDLQGWAWNCGEVLWLSLQEVEGEGQRVCGDF